jgi:energy-coupling factor transporter ATP-binding protein EcfA2
MLPENHPHAWDADYADQYLDHAFRREYMPDGARLLVTPDMDRLISRTPVSLERSKCTVVSGPWGSGKSTLLQALAAVSDVNTVSVEIPESATAPAAQWEVMTTAITGTANGTARAMQNQCRDYLVEVPTLLIVDEAQHLTHAALRQLRWLWTSKLPKFAIVLAGSNLEEHIYKEKSVYTRVNRRILLRSHSPEQMLDLLRRSDPALADTDPELLHLIEEAYGHGVWRNWSELMLKATTEFDHHGPLDHQTAADVILDRTGRPLGTTRVGATSRR